MMRSSGWSIGALAQQAGCNVQTIRYYESIGLLPEADRGSGGHRVFGPRHLRRLTFIRRSRELGFSLDQVRALLRLSEGSAGMRAEACGIAESHLREVRLKMAQLQKLATSLESFINACDTHKAEAGLPDCGVLESLFDPEAGAAG